MKISKSKFRRVLKDLWDVALINGECAETERKAKRYRNQTVEEFLRALDKDSKKTTAARTIRALIRKPKKRKNA